MQGLIPVPGPKNCAKVGPLHSKNGSVIEIKTDVKKFKYTTTPTFRTDQAFVGYLQS